MARIGAVLLALALILGLAAMLDAPKPIGVDAPVGSALCYLDKQPAVPSAEDISADVESRLDAAVRTVTARLERQSPDPVPSACRTPAQRALPLLRTTERSSAWDAPSEPG